MNIIEILFTNNNHVKLVVEMPNPDRYLTEHAPHIPRLLFKYLPHLASHKCNNDKGFSFRKECRSTEIPHLFEHLIIELQSQVLKSGVLRGETEWDWRIDPKGRFHVDVEYDNELLVLGAIRVAQRLINALDNNEIEKVDIDTEVRQLAKLVELGEEIRMGAISKKINKEKTSI